MSSKETLLMNILTSVVAGTGYKGVFVGWFWRRLRSHLSDGGGSGSEGGRRKRSEGGMTHLFLPKGSRYMSNYEKCGQK